MNRGSGKPGQAITPDEAELWSRLGQSLDKVKGKPRVTSHGANPGHAAPPATPKPAVSGGARPSATAPSGAKPPAPLPKPSRLAPLAEFDRRTARQVASGKLAIDARLDLHGVRRRDARAHLQTFLFASQESGCKTVLVITGKGHEAAERDHLAAALGEPQRGQFRRLVPQWLEDPDLRSVVLSYTTASVRHGGNGALYVQLRRRAR